MKQTSKNQFIGIKKAMFGIMNIQISAKIEFWPFWFNRTLGQVDSQVGGSKPDFQLKG